MVDHFYIDLGVVVKYLFILCVSGDFSVPYYMYVILWLCAMTSLANDRGGNPTRGQTETSR